LNLLVVGIVFLHSRLALLNTLDLLQNLTLLGYRYTSNGSLAFQGPAKKELIRQNVMRILPKMQREESKKAAENVHDFLVQLLDGFPRTLVGFVEELLQVILQGLDLGLKTTATAIDRAEVSFSKEEIHS
jgi:hypothetical protein